MRVPVVPFLTPSDDTINHGGWFLNGDEDDLSLPGEIQHWDYQTVLNLSAALRVNRTELTDQCGLSWDTALEVLVLARSTHTRTERVVRRVDVPLYDVTDLALIVELPGQELGGRLTLETLLVASDPIGDEGTILSPKQPGSILWRADHHTHLEGIGAQFPTDSADFSVTNPHLKNAGWELRIETADPEALFMSATRLTLNSGLPAIQKLLAGGRDDQTNQLLRTLNWDVTRQMVFMALATEGVASADVDPDAVSVQGVLRNLVGAIWPTESIATLKRWSTDDPSRIEITIQNHCRLMP